ncbi:TIGR03862 family flavoprotein [Terrarubrum flagellatum]|uniref:TIGR03862 family flavoprotein n=1 Tax=Terrirubrum flagellatum TaxID=2895980 RepID=UPI0031456584
MRLNTHLALTATIHIIGAGPAGLIAAETLAAAGVSVIVHERMPSVARKFLMAGRGGLNLTHSEPLGDFLARYGDAALIRGAVASFPSAALRGWAEGLGQGTFVGSSGRIFPLAMKASPLLRAWLARLGALGVRIETRSEWRGFSPDGSLLISSTGQPPEAMRADAVILACGGASWPRLGSDGGWTAALEKAGVAIAPFRPANMGVVCDWSPLFATRFAGTPLKRIVLRLGSIRAPGEIVITATGLEGGAVYPLSPHTRDSLAAGRDTVLRIDLRPDLSQAELRERLAANRAKDSLSTKLKRGAGLSPVAIHLVREATGNAPPTDARALTALIKDVPIRARAMQGLARAISSAGGVALDELDADFMLKARPGVFAAGEMLDWEAPTGGYLLQACFASGIAAAKGALAWLGRP